MYWKAESNSQIVATLSCKICSKALVCVYSFSPSKKCVEPMRVLFLYDQEASTHSA